MTGRARAQATRIVTVVVSMLIGATGAAPGQPTPNRIAEYASGERPWLQCGVEQTLEVDFEGTARPYHVEWRRCGPRQAEWKPDRTIDYPIHYVTVTRSAASAKPLFVFDNATEPGLTYIE